MKTYPISKSEAVEKVVDELTGLTPLEEIIDRVLELWPSRAKNPRYRIKQEVQYHSGRKIVFLDREMVAPIWSALEGVRFRVPVIPGGFKGGRLPIDVLCPLVFKEHERPENVRLVDQNGESLPTEIVAKTVQLETILGSYEAEVSALDLSEWFGSRDVKVGDSILVTILDRRAGELALEHEPADHRREDAIARQNQELADRIYDLVFNHYLAEAPISQVIPSAYAGLSNPRGYPGDHWADVVEEDYRLRLGFFDSICLSTHRSLLDILTPMQDYDWPVPLSPEQKRQAHEREAKVYRFKAALKYRKGLWRRLEILGSQTMGDLDDMMRDAFEHDWGDHLSEFYLPIGGRHKPMGLGGIEPFGGGEGRDPLVSHLGLEVGDRLEYIYDFGDSIRHSLTLEAIEEPEEKATYPRQVGQNKPRYRYCEHCKEKGKKTVATWICVECSDREGRPVLVCEDCLREHHVDHYGEELLY